jgi:enoyl-CoA hydratase
MTDEVVIRVENGLGRITLNRPKALHALTTEMCAGMAEALTAWEHDPAVRAVVVDHSEGTRGFCAGGDIRKVAESGRGDGVAAADFFRVEYTLNARIKHYPKPYIALMDGITMGGGVGISVHGSHRIATDRTIFAMPETGIGLFPDVGGGWFLPRLEGELGTWLALTGAQLRGSDVHAAGIATHYVPVLDDLKAELLAGGDIDGVFGKYARPAPAPAYAEHREVMNRCFSKDSMTDICLALKLDDSDWAEAQAAVLSRRSPLSCSVALRQLREGRRQTDFDEVMRMEYRIACHITRSHDFSEGVRAVIEDKDNAPRWRPEILAGVTPKLVDAMFAPVACELEL